MARRSSLLGHLEAEWNTLLSQRSWINDYQQLARAHDLAAFGTAADVAERLRSNERAEDDLILGALLGARPDPCALRVLLHAFLPTARRVANHHRALTADRDELEAAVVAATWERLVTYPLAARPTSIAANIALDIRKHVPRHIAEPQAIEAAPPEATPGPPSRTSDEELIAATTNVVNANVLNAGDAAELLNCAFDAHNINEIARTRGRSRRYTQAQLAKRALVIRDALQ